ncbi:MAG: hypothetical protein RLY93_07490 [Sumerlaeia bacterium]
MIRINLLAQQQASGKAAAAPKAGGGGGFNATGLLVAVILLIALGAALGSALMFFNRVRESQLAVERLQAEKKSIDAEINKKRADSEDLARTLSVLKTQYVVLQALDPPDRLLWSRKLNVLPMYVPGGIFLTDITVTENVKEVELPESRRRYADWEKNDKKGTPPTRTFKPVITQQMSLKGVSFVTEGGSSERIRKIIDFYNDLRDKKVTLEWNGEEVNFMDKFKDEEAFSDFESVEIDKRQCTKFAFNFTTRELNTQVDLESAELPGAEAPAARPAARRGRPAADEGNAE